MADRKTEAEALAEYRAEVARRVEEHERSTREHVVHEVAKRLDEQKRGQR